MSCGLDICYCQSNSIIYNILYCFNTSHITLYRKQSKSVRRQVTCFNTSHVTLYLSMSIKFPHCKHCFNTSHVTLYRQSISLLHLYLKFQYISCYSLSIIETLWNVKKFVSIHLMLLFIGGNEWEKFFLRQVSIHLMLLFIHCTGSWSIWI